MRPGGRYSAAIEILDDIFDRHRLAAVSLQDWARANRFAGSGDRAVIGNLVYDVLRRKASCAHRMADGSARSLVIAALATHWGQGADEIDSAFCEQYGPGGLSDDEREQLASRATDAPAHVAGDWPEWLMGDLEHWFGRSAVDQARALAERAPVDLRVNTLKATREQVLKAMEKYGAEDAPLSPLGVRLPVPPAAGRNPNVEVDPAHARGWFEVQDAGSQVAGLMADAKPGMQVADICAGAGGKTLALAAAMNNKGQLFAHDTDKHRLRPIFERIGRAGVRNVQVIAADEPERLEPLEARMHRVLVDAPCSGSGAWRRRPDAKWRFNKRLLADRLEDQKDVLDSAAALVRPGGRLIYVTCSVLAQENGDQVKAFLKRQKGYTLLPYADVWRAAIGTEPPVSADGRADALLLTPATHGTDGFYIAVMERA